MAKRTTTVTVRYFAAAAAAAGCTTERVALPRGADLRQVKSALAARHGPRMERVLTVAAFLVGSELTRDLDRRVGTRLDVLPPFAGG